MSHLLYKLEALGITGDILNWLKAFLTGRCMATCVPQDSVLGPFLSYFDISTVISHSKIELFADDVTIRKYHLLMMLSCFSLTYQS